MTRGVQNGYDKGGVATPLMSVTSPDSTLSIRIYTFLYSYILQSKPINFQRLPSQFGGFAARRQSDVSVET